MKFTKMHGIGNDYVYINAMQYEIEDPSALAVSISDRHFGIGSDGLILIKASDKADFMMDMYNADGSRSQMCGNGIRCVGKYVYDHGLTDKKIITIETLAGVKTLNLVVRPVEEVEGYKAVSNNGMVVAEATVNMGRPILEPENVPVTLPDGYHPENVMEVMKGISGVGIKLPMDDELDGINIDKDEKVAIHMPIVINETIYYGTCVSMGNPHVIVFVDETADYPLEQQGPLFENYKCFPERINTEFVQVLDRKHVNMRVWERGSGETLACGTGASATTVACILNGKTDDEITVSLLGGDLKIRWDREQNLVFMTGPATTVYEGEF